MGNLEITIEDKRGSEVQNKYDIDELLLMLTLRHTLTNRNSISPYSYTLTVCPRYKPRLIREGTCDCSKVMRIYVISSLQG